MMRGALLTIAVLAAASSPATAQVNDAAAEALFHEGRQLMAAGQFAEAADKFAASDRASPSVGARINLGDCFKKLDKTASAWTAYRSAVNLAEKNEDRRRARAATRLADELEPKLVHVIVSVPSAARVPGLEVEIAGSAIPAALWNQRFPIDPGEHPVVATAPERQAWTGKVAAGPPGAVITVDIPALESSAAGEARPPDPELPGGAVEPGIARAEDRRPGHGRRILGLGVAGAGAVAAGVGVAFGVGARSRWNDAFDSDLCVQETKVCSSEGQALTDSARSRANLANIFVGAGAVLAAAGVVLYLTAPDGEAGAISAAPWLEAGGLGVAARGRF